MNKAIAIICIILGIVLFLGVGFGVYVLLEATNYCKNWATDFWITVDGKRYYSDGSELVFFDTEIYVHYLVDWLSKKQGYTYKLVAADDFEYLVNGSVYHFSDIEDLTLAFEVVERDNGFTLKCKGKTINEVLRTVHSGSEIVVPDSVAEQYPFKLIVTSVDGKTISLTFRCVLMSIELNPPAIVF